MGREAAYTGQKIFWKDDAAPAAPEGGGKDAKADKKSARVALAIMSSKQDLAPDNLLFADKFEPTPLPIPGVTQFV